MFLSVLTRNLSVILTATGAFVLLGAFVLSAVIMFPNASRSAEGIMNSISFAKVPYGSTIVIESSDDSDDTLQILRAFKSAIRTAGYAPSDTGKLLMIFEARNDIGSFSTRNRRYILSLETMGARLGGGQNSLAKVNVFNSNTGGLLNKGRGTTIITSPSTYEIDVTIEDRASGEILWQGWVSTELRNNVGIEYTEHMIRKIVETIGKTVRQENFSLF